MNNLPRELQITISEYLSQSDIVMLSLTCKSLYTLFRVYEPILDVVVKDGNLNYVKLVESWGNNTWLKDTYINLGISGSMELLEWKCVSKYLFANFNKLTKENAKYIYQGAAIAGNINILEWIDSSFSNPDLDEAGFYAAASNNQYKSLDYFIRTNNPYMEELMDCAIKSMDISLVKYCLDKNLEYDVDPLMGHDNRELKPFLEECISLGVEFTPCEPCFEHFENTLEVVSLGLCELENLSIRVSDAFAIKNVSTVDWDDERQRKFMYRCVREVIFRCCTLDYFSMRKFFKFETKHNQTFKPEYYQEILDIIHEFK